MIRSVETTIYTTVGAQPFPEEVLLTMLLEVEGILILSLYGYVSSGLSFPSDTPPLSPSDGVA